MANEGYIVLVIPPDGEKAGTRHLTDDKGLCIYPTRGEATLAAKAAAKGGEGYWVKPRVAPTGGKR